MTSGQNISHYRTAKLSVHVWNHDLIWWQNKIDTQKHFHKTTITISWTLSKTKIPILKRRTTKKTPSHYCLSLQRSHMFSGPMDSPQRCQWYFIIPLCKYSAPLASCGIFFQRTQNSPYCLFGVHYLSKISSFILPSTLPCNNPSRYIKSLKYRHDSHQFYISESQEWGRS